MEEFAGRTAVITGAASGIGRGLARAAAARGMNVVAADLDPGRLDALAADLDLGMRLLTAVTDVSRSECVSALAEAAYGRFGAVHLLFNNAGVLTTGKAWEQAPAAWSWLFGVNVMGVVHGIHAFVPRMLAGGEAGMIVNTASMAGLFGAAELAPYTASKHAVVGLSECLLYDLQAEGSALSVAVICPGAVRTDLMRADHSAGGPVLHQAPGLRDTFQAAMDERGMAPDALAQIVFDHIERGAFWILPHPHMLRRVDQRMASLRDGEAPRLPASERV